MSKHQKTITEFRSYYLPAEFPILLLTGEHWHISDKPSSRLHFHNCLELGLCHEGSGILQIKKDSHPFHSNDITFIAANIPHTTYSTAGTTSKWSYIFVDLAEMFDSFLSVPSHQVSQMIHDINTAGIIRNEENPFLASYFSLLMKELTSVSTNYQLNVRALLLSFLIELHRQCSRLTDKPQPDNCRQNYTLAIIPALEYIKYNYPNQFPIETLADICGLSPTHFRRIFSTTMGTSPLEYLNTIRITKACHLLKSTQESVLNISERVGFHSISSFNRYFIRLVHMSPREYRRSSVDEEALRDTVIVKFSGWTQPEI